MEFLFNKKFLIVSLVFISIGFAESCGESRRLVVGIQVRNITESAHTEGSDALTAFFGCQGCHR